MHMAQLLSGFRSNTATVTDLCPICLSLHHCLFRTFTLILAQLIQTGFSQFLLAFPPGSHRGVGRKRRKQLTSLKFCYFALRCAHTVPSAPGSHFLGFTPRCRPAAGGPAPSLTKSRFPPVSVCGVGRKRARDALSQFCLTLFCLLFLLVFAQTYTTQDAQHTQALSQRCVFAHLTVATLDI